MIRQKVYQLEQEQIKMKQKYARPFSRLCMGTRAPHFAATNPPSLAL